jgi:RNA-directed DNA polymerase
MEIKQRYIDDVVSGLKTEKHLAATLNWELDDIRRFIRDQEQFYYIKEEIKKDKRGKIKFDENGKPKIRLLNPSKGDLKLLQKRIAYRILARLPLPHYIKGGVKGTNNIANGRAHLGKNHKFKTDMKDYYPSIHPDRVYGMFIRVGFSSKVATLLTHLTTHNFQLPQGTPTSPYIANLIFIPADLQIADFCQSHQITYTRFVDDLVFSSQTDFEDHTTTLLNFIINEGFAVGSAKTYYKLGKMDITGTSVGQNEVNTTKDFKELIADPTIAATTTAGRLRYQARVRSSNKKQKVVLIPVVPIPADHIDDGEAPF